MAYAEGVEAELRVAMVGCGPRAHHHARLLDRMTGVRLEAVCDPLASPRRTMAEEFGIGRRYERIERMLDAAALDAVLVNVPPHLNAEAAMVCLEAGIDTLVEKPPGLHVAETRALRAAAERNGARCMVGLNRRFNPLIAAAKRRVAERGPLVTVVGEFHKNLVEIEQQGRIAEPTLARFFYETPIHALDCVRWLAGAPVRAVYSFSQRAVSRHRDAFGALMEFDNSCIVHLIANITSGARLERYEIHGAGISAYLDGVSRGHVVVDGEVTELSGDGASSTLEQDRYFLDCIREDRPIEAPACGLDEAVATMELAALIHGD
jgi:predicted dehydrogenase